MNPRSTFAPYDEYLIRSSTLRLGHPCTLVILIELYNLNEDVESSGSEQELPSLRCMKKNPPHFSAILKLPKKLDIWRMHEWTLYEYDAFLCRVQGTGTPRLLGRLENSTKTHDQGVEKAVI
ncbi:unnamed protein product [Arabidopsis arenosa]|uniref:Uncharacterized protein n=1 Tax=Arabidopsis arenosa TaxID=38785 RepID=A0A8S2A6J6_ARAAE|nr:unnamed protein product [Arabidopsis arenosa]